MAIGLVALVLAVVCKRRCSTPPSLQPSTPPAALRSVRIVGSKLCADEAGRVFRAFSVRYTHGSTVYRTFHRYNDFVALHERLASRCTSVFPVAKTFFPLTDPVHIAERRSALERYLESLLAVPQSERKIVEEFLVPARAPKGASPGGAGGQLATGTRCSPEKLECGYSSFSFGAFSRGAPDDGEGEQVGDSFEQPVTVAKVQQGALTGAALSRSLSSGSAGAPRALAITAPRAPRLPGRAGPLPPKAPPRAAAIRANKSGASPALASAGGGARARLALFSLLLASCCAAAAIAALRRFPNWEAGAPPGGPPGPRERDSRPHHLAAGSATLSAWPKGSALIRTEGERWTTACAGALDERAASVLCRQLGYDSLQVCARKHSTLPIGTAPDVPRRALRVLPKT